MDKVMSGIWKVVAILAVVLLLLGIAAFAVGYFTGASVDRMVEVRFGGWDTVEMFIKAIREGLVQLFNSYF